MLFLNAKTPQKLALMIVLLDVKIFNDYAKNLNVWFLDLIKMNNILTLIKIYLPVMKGKRCIVT